MIPSKGNFMEMAVTTKNIIELLIGYLSCTQKTISTLIGVNEATLSSNLDKPIDEIRTKKTGKRLLALAGIVNFLGEQGLSSAAIMEIITVPSYRDYEGRMDSLKSILMSEKYNLDFDILMLITQQAQREYVSRNHIRNSAKSNISSYLHSNLKIKTAI